MSYGWIMQIVKGGVAAGQASDQYKERFKQEREIAERVQAYDAQVMQSAAQSIGRLNVERAGMHRQVTSALAALRSKKRAYQASVAAGNAATDTVGASADAVLSDANVQADKALANVRENLDVQDFLITQKQGDVLTQAGRGMKADQLADTLGRKTVAWDIFKVFVGTFLGSGSTPVQQPTDPSRTSTGQQSTSNGRDSQYYTDEYSSQGEKPTDFDWGSSSGSGSSTGGY